MGPDRAPRRTYLDAAAVAPVRPSAREAWLAAIDDGWADPRRLHTEGRRARLLLDGAREAVAAALGTRTEEVSFAGSHVEATTAAILGVLRARHRTGDAAVTSAAEHSAVLNALAFGCSRVATIPVDRSGRLDESAFGAAVGQDGVALACVQSANGEVGTVQPVDTAAEAATAAGVPLLVDAAASVGHVPPPARWDALVADPRAWGSVPGAGVLALREGTRWQRPGPEAEGLERSGGDVAVPAVLAAAVALQEAVDELDGEGRRLKGMVDQIRGAAGRLPDTEVLGDPDHRLPHIVTFSCLYVDGEVLLGELDRAGFAVGSGSACTASTLRPSHVLAAMGVLTHGNVRLGLSPDVTQDDVDAFCAALPGAVQRVRSLLGASEL